MSRNFKLAIVRARNDTNVPVISDQACRQMLMTGSQSVLRYWSDTTGGWLDFRDSAMFPWVDITISASDTSRATQATRAFAALRAANPGFDPLAGFDGALVITHPGRMTVPNPMASTPGQPPTIMLAFDGGSSPNIAGLRTSVVPVMPSDHTFMCHELGHTLGFDHTFGVDNNGTDWNPADATIIVGPEYGSPYDLMSSASFGTRWLGTGPFWTGNPTFAGTPVAGWPAPGAFSMGPHLSRANLHLWFPQALDPAHTEHRSMPASGAVSRARISATSTNGRTLLVLHPPGEPPSGVGRVYIEYRDNTGWDRGIDVAGSDLARTGVVVHTVEKTPGGATCAWYRGTVIAGSIDLDLEVAGRPLVITLDDFDKRSPQGSQWAEISCRTSIAREVMIRKFNVEEIVLGGTPIREEETPCGQTITWGHWASTTGTYFQATTTGFGGTSASSPVVTWTVAGVPLAGTSGQAQVPVGDVTYPVDYTIDPVSYELQLWSGGGLRFPATDVTATATLGAQSASASNVFRARGFYDGYTPEDEAVLSACLASIIKRANIPRQLPRFRIPVPDPGPEYHIDEWREGALQQVRDLDLDRDTTQRLEVLVLLQAPRGQ